MNRLAVDLGARRGIGSFGSPESIGTSLNTISLFNLKNRSTYPYELTTPQKS